MLLGLSRQPEARSLLVEALRDASETVRFAAVESLVRGGPEVKDTVRPLLESPEGRLRTASATILGRIDPAQYAATILPDCASDHLEVAYRGWGYLTALAPVPPSPALKRTAMHLHGKDRRPDH